jgi:hypothetical protein
MRPWRFSSVFASVPTAVNHIDARKLFEAAHEKLKLSDEERKHTHECEDCAHLLRVFAKQRIHAVKKPAGKGSAA